MAEALFKAELNKQGRDILVFSAGLQALVDYPADPIAQLLMKKKGLDITHHRARQVTPEIIFASDLILTMSTDQKRTLEAQCPYVFGKVFRLGDYDIIDPYQRIPAIFEQSLAQIEHNLQYWYKTLMT